MYDSIVSRGAAIGDQVQVRSGQVGSGQLIGWTWWVGLWNDSDEFLSCYGTFHLRPSTLSVPWEHLSLTLVRIAFFSNS